MTITYELDLANFEAWSGAVDTLERIKREDKISQLESILEDLYPDGMTETQLNDLLWFDSDTVYGWLGIRTESEIRDEITDKEEELDELMSEYREAVEELSDEEKEEVYNDDYKDDVESLQAEIEELKEELENI